jgi:hypothetical protein
MDELEKQLNELRVQNKIARAALFDNIQALDVRAVELERKLGVVEDLLTLQLKINKDLVAILEKRK